MPGPSLLAKTLRGRESQTSTSSRAGTDRLRPLPTSTDCREGRHPLGPHEFVHCNTGRPTAGLYHCREGGNLSPHGRRHWGESPPGRPHRTEGRGVSPTPLRRPRFKQGNKPRPASGWRTQGTASLPAAIPSAPPTCLRYRRCPRRPAAERHSRACAPNHLLRPSCVLASEAAPSRPPSRVRSPRREAAENRAGRLGRLICISPAPQRTRVAVGKGSLGPF